MRKTLVVILASALLCASCASQPANDALTFDSASLFGMIYDENNQPCGGARLTIDGQPGPQTDIRGRFVVADLSRGQHAIVARKDGYEDLSVQFTFLNRTDVLYLRMISFDQLLSRAERAFDERKWDDAEAALRRAAKLDSGDTVMMYLEAIRQYKTEKYADAARQLESILSRGEREPYVYLFLADLYEQNLNDLSKAAEYLQRYLERRADADVEKRLADLKAKIAAKDPTKPAE
jgi:tetratricopeptide (TPR) repeat protein